METAALRLSGRASGRSAPLAPKIQLEMKDRSNREDGFPNSAAKKRPFGDAQPKTAVPTKSSDQPMWQLDKPRFSRYCW